MAEEQQMVEEVAAKDKTRVLIAVDHSENARHAFQYYVDHIHKPENDVILFHVSDQVHMPMYSYLGGIEGAAYSYNADEIGLKVEELRRRNKALEKKFDEICKGLQMKHEFLLVSHDGSGEGHAICEHAKKHDVNLIVVGSRGLGTLRRTILGSVSTYVIHHSHIPSLVCPVK